MLFPSQNAFLMLGYLSTCKFWLDDRPLILDLFCGAGGAAWGYYEAGFIPVGVDIAKQDNYPFLFIQMDALHAAGEYHGVFDFIHASPPCQRYSTLNRIVQIAASTKTYADLVCETRVMLRFIGLPYVIENVAGAPLRNPITLCGSQFPDLRVYRHRLFETSMLMQQPKHAPHKDNTPPAGQGVSDKGYLSITSGGVKRLPDGWTSPAAYKNYAMGIEWMTQDELTESIPPAFTRYIGMQLIGCMQNAEAA
jgi:DNA (cytosine-5)-methyltransferase 1